MRRTRQFSQTESEPQLELPGEQKGRGFFRISCCGAVVMATAEDEKTTSKSAPTALPPLILSRRRQQRSLNSTGGGGGGGGGGCGGDQLEKMEVSDLNLPSCSRGVDNGGNIGGGGGGGDVSLTTPLGVEEPSVLLELYNNVCAELRAKHDQLADYEKLLQLMRLECASIEAARIQNADNHTVTTAQRTYKLDQSIRIVAEKIEQISTGMAEAEFQREAQSYLNIFHDLRAQLDEWRLYEDEKSDSTVPPPRTRDEINEEIRDLTSKFVTAFKSIASPGRRVATALRLSRTQKETYRRINHFREFLRQIQGKSRGAVPQIIIDSVRAELKKYRIRFGEAQPKDVRKALKRLRQASYYEHIVSITMAINHTYRPLDIPEYRIEKLCALFIKTERPFNRVRHLVNRHRKNFLSYPYLMYQLCQLLGWDEYLNELKLLQPELLIPQDKWWRLMCKQLQWQPMRTVGSISL